VIFSTIVDWLATCMDSNGIHAKAERAKALPENDMESKTMRAGARCLGACGLAGVFLLTACSTAPANQQQSDARLRQQAAQATEKAKVDARVAAKDARHAAGVAVRRINDVAQGVKEGIRKPAPGEPMHPVNINTASQAELETLPGVGRQTAENIIAHRPYQSRRDIVSKGAIRSAEYDRIASSIRVD
jgi:competence protein ComEA